MGGFFVVVFFTYLHDSSENRGVVHGAAVPAAVPELVLALLDAHLGAFTDVMDVVLVELTQLLLALRQAHQLAAQRLCADDVSLWDQQRVHGQRPAATGGGVGGGTHALPTATKEINRIRSLRQHLVD